VVPQALKPYLPSGIHIPGSTLPAPATEQEAYQQAIHVATFGLGDAFERNKAKAVQAYDPTRKNPDGTLASLEDDARTELHAGYDTFMDASGFRALGRGLSNNYPAGTKPPTSGERLADVVGGGMGAIATVLGIKSLVGGRLPGVSLMEQQALERTKAATKVVTANDIATELGLADGSRIVEAARGDITLEELADAQNLQKITDFQERAGAPAGAPLAAGIPNGPIIATKLGKQSSKIVDNTIVNDMGQSMKMLDGTEMYIDVVDPTSDLSKRMQSTQIDQAMLSIPELKDIVLKVRRSDILQQLTAKNPGMLDNHLIAASVANGTLDAEYITDIATRMGVTPEVATQQLVNHLVHTASTSSKTMSVYNLGAGALEAYRGMQEWFGEKRAADILQNLSSLGNKPILENINIITGTLQDLAGSMVAKQKKALKRMADSPLANTVKGALTNVSRLSTASMLGFIGTPLRNFENALGMANGIAGFEDFLVDAAASLGGSKVGSALGVTYPAAARRNVLANVTSDFAKMLMGRGELAQGMRALVDAVPTTSKYLRGSGSQLLGHLAELHSTGIPIADGIMNAYSSVIHAVNTFAELPMRQAIFGARTVKGIEAIKHWDQIVAAVPEVNSPIGRMEFAQEWATNPTKLGAKYGLSEAQIAEVDSEMRLVMGDAKIHTLKQQLSFSTEKVQAFVDYYHSFPFADALGVAFPKMIYNTWRWTLEHNPANLFSILDDGVRERIMAGAEGGFQTRAAQRDYAKAVSGAAMMGLAYGVRSGAFSPVVEPGSRPHEIKTGDMTTDIRMFSPLDKYLTMAEVMHNVMGKGISLEEALSMHTPAELADLAIGQRRMGDVPLFGLEKFFQDVTTGEGDRTTERFKKLAGDFMGRFSTPLRNAKLITDLIYPEDQYQPDFNKHPMTGPTINHLPGPVANALGPKYRLEPRIDPTTGKAMGENPSRLSLVLAVAGFKTEAMPKLTETLQRLNFPMHLLVGNNGDERLDRAKGIELGKILQESVAHDPGNGGKIVNMPLGEYIAGPMLQMMAEAEGGDKMKDPMYINSQATEKLKQLFSSYGLKALKAAYAKYPQLLNESKIMAMEEFTPMQRKALLAELGRMGLLDAPAEQAPNK
jgi:hypothetical protein